jgi:hypothetical protein
MMSDECVMMNCATYTYDSNYTHFRLGAAD